MALEIGKTQKKKFEKKSNTGDFFQNFAKIRGIKMLTIASLPKETAKKFILKPLTTFWGPWGRRNEKKTKSFKKSRKNSLPGDEETDNQ